MNTPRPYDYIAFIDEAGESGLQSVRPIDPKGSTEWLILGGVLIAADREKDTLPWVWDAMKEARTQQKILHFANLRHPLAQEAICRSLAKQPARFFVVASNKKNMVGYKNPFAAARAQLLIGRPPGWNYNWFYYWISRVLLEKMSNYALWRSMRDYGEPRIMRVEFSENQGLNYQELGFYYDLLKMHDKMDTQVRTFDRIKWAVIDRDQLHSFRHENRAGLQIADVVASAFYQACDNQFTGPCNPTFARLLRPLMTCRSGRRRPAGYGVKLMPHMDEAKLSPDQAQIFHEYGYPRSRR